MKINYFMRVIILIVVLFTINSECANILVLETVPSPSHHIWIRSLTIELARRGHNVTSISQDIDPEPTANLHYIHLEKVYSTLFNDGKNKTESLDFFEFGQTKNPWKELRMFSDFVINACAGSLKSDGLKQLLAYPDNFKFDVVLHDYMAHPCLLGFLHKFNYPPMIGLSAFNAPSTTIDLVGSQMYLYMPNIFRNELNTKFVRRVESLLLHIYDYGLKHYYMYPKMNELSRVLYPNAPNMTDLLHHTNLILMNSHPAVEFAEPLLPNVIPVGGMQIARPKQLPEDLQIIADSARKGLILFSMGINVDSKNLGDTRIRHILEAFRNLPSYIFFWKIDPNAVKGDVPANVHILEWIPQIELLAHRNTLLFVSHCGLLSTQEAAWFGIPMLAIPIFADQFLNAEIAKRAGIAESLDLNNLTAFTLRESILKVSRNLTYRLKAKLRSDFFRDQPQLPLNRAIWWVERVIRNPELTFYESPVKYLNYFAKHGYDVVAFILTVTLILIWIIIMLIRLLIKKIVKQYKWRHELNVKYMKSL